MFKLSRHNQNMQMFGVPPNTLPLVIYIGIFCYWVLLHYTMSFKTIAGGFNGACFLMVWSTFWRSRIFLTNLPKLSCGFKSLIVVWRCRVGGGGGDSRILVMPNSNMKKWRNHRSWTKDICYLCLAGIRFTANDFQDIAIWNWTYTVSGKQVFIDITIVVLSSEVCWIQ